MDYPERFHRDISGAILYRGDRTLGAKIIAKEHRPQFEFLIHTLLPLVDNKKDLLSDLLTERVRQLFFVRTLPRVISIVERHPELGAALYSRNVNSMGREIEVQINNIDRFVSLRFSWDDWPLSDRGYFADPQAVHKGYWVWIFQAWLWGKSPVRTKPYHLIRTEPYHLKLLCVKYRQELMDDRLANRSLYHLLTQAALMFFTCALFNSSANGLSKPSQKDSSDR